jgi:hypothetical protein
MFILPQGRWRARSGNRSFSLPVIFYDVAESGRKAFRPCRIGLLRERVGLHSAPQARIDRPVDKLGASHPLPQAAFKLASLLRQARLAQAVDNGLKLGEIRRIVAHRCPGGVGAGDGKGRVECKAGLDGGPRLAQSAKLREGGAQHRLRDRGVITGGGAAGWQASAAP